MVLFDNELRDEVTTPNHQGSCVLNGRPLISVGTKIYSIYKRYAGMPRAVCQEYTATASITSLEVSGNFLSVSVTGGVNAISASRATAYLDTPEITGNPNGVEVSYSAGGQYVTISTNSDGAGFVAQTPIVDSIRKIVYFDGGLPDTVFFQARIGLSNTAVINNIKL